MTKNSSIRLLVVVIFSALFGAGQIFAQSTVTGAISGNVTDPQGAVVPNASITITNAGTNKATTIASSDQGAYRLANLTPGIYRVETTVSGFPTVKAENVVVEVGQTTTVDLALSLGSTTANVEVTAEAPAINTSDNSSSTNFNQTSINELPVNGRRWSNFALLSPGAVPDGTFGLISFRGISGLLNNSTVDGGDNNQAFFAEERGRTRISYSISQSAIREFQVNTSSYSAEYGRSAGGVVNAVTKSGTNEFHGDLFYYQRNNKWGARNPRSFITQNVGGAFVPVAFKPEDVRHQFGGTIGGPIMKDKAFFFFSYDEQRRNFPGVSTFTALDFLNRADTCALTAAAGAAITLATCPAYPGTTGATRTGTLATGKGLTANQVTTALNFLNSISGEVPRTGNQRLFLPKFDWNINSKNTFTATYNHLRWDSPAGIQTQAINTRARDNFGDDGVNIDSLNVRLATTISPTMFNEFRYQWGRDFEFQLSSPPLPGEPTTSLNGRSPQTFLTNGFSFGIPEFLERAAFPDERRNQFADTITMVRGDHSVKFGGDINFVKDIINNLRFSGGEFNYTGGVNGAGYYGGLNDFIIDYTNFLAALPAASPCYSSTRTRGKCYGGNFNQGLGVFGLTMKTTDYNFFVQDDWRVSNRLTVNLGLRYEYQKNPRPINVNPALPGSATYVDDNNNWGPRIGFAYDLTGKGTASLRGGYGVYYGRVINSTVYNALVNTGVGIDRGQRQTTLLASAAAAPIYPNLLAAGALVTPAVQYFSADFQLPRVQQVDAVFEQEIGHNTVMSVSYLASFGSSLPNFVDTNLSPPTATGTFIALGGPFDGQAWKLPLFLGARPNAAFAQMTEIRSDVFSRYHALVVQANRRLTSGLQFQVNYTLSQAKDNGQSSVTFTSNNLPFNAFDQAGEYGLSAFDRTHKFVASLVYNTKFKGGSHASRAILNGWTIAPIVNAFSGATFTPTVSGTVSPPNNFGIAGGTQAGGLNGSGGSTRFALLPRSSFRQPSIIYVDLRLSRRFSLSEKMKLELLAEGFNIFNRTQVTGVSAGIYSIDTTGSAGSPRPFLNFSSGPTGFNSVTGADSTLFRERQIQLAARFQF